MSTSLGEAVLDLVGDGTQLKKDIAAAKTDAQQTLKNLGSSMTKIGGTMTAAITAPIVAMGFSMINAASDVEESLSKVRVVFGDFSDDVIEASEGSAEAWGISQGQALEAMGTFGNLFVAMGVGAGDAADLSVNLAGLAADLGSFNNMDPTEVLDKLRAGLTGEAEGLKSLGVALKAAEVDTRALEIATADGREEITEADRILARYNIIMEQTAVAHGDFERTSDGLANSTRILQAQLKDEAAALGQELLPFALQAVGVIRDLIDKFQNLDPSVKENILKAIGLAAALGPIILIGGQLIGAISGIIGVVSAAGPVLATIAGVLTGPVGIAIAAVVALVGALYLAWKNNFLGIQQTVETFVAIVKSIFAAFKAAFQGDWEGFGRHLREAWDTFWNLISERFEAAKTWLTEAVQNLIRRVVEFFTQTDWGEVGRNIIRGIRDGLRSAVQWLVDAAIGVVTAAIDAVKGFLGIDSASKLFKTEVGFNMALGMGEGFIQAIPAVTSDVESGADRLVSGLDTAGAGVRGGSMIGQANIYNNMDLDRFASEIKRRS